MKAINLVTSQIIKGWNNDRWEMKLKEKDLTTKVEENFQQMLCPKGYKCLMNMTQMIKSKDEAFSTITLSEGEANEARILNLDDVN